MPAMSVVSAPCSASFVDVIGTTPVTFEFRAGRWVAVMGQFGIVELTRDTYDDVRAEAEALYLHGRQSAA